MTALASVPATLNYSVDNGRPPDYYFYEPDPGTVLNPPGTDLQPVDIHDAWHLREQLSLDREGFELHDFAAPFSSFDDDAAVKSVFYAQVVDFVKAHTGARMVMVFDHTIRAPVCALTKSTTCA